jgi:hypothetical protein
MAESVGLRHPEHRRDRTERTAAGKIERHVSGSLHLPFGEWRVAPRCSDHIRSAVPAICLMDLHTRNGRGLPCSTNKAGGLAPNAVPPPDSIRKQRQTVDSREPDRHRRSAIRGGGAHRDPLRIPLIPSQRVSTAFARSTFCPCFSVRWGLCSPWSPRGSGPMGSSTQQQAAEGPEAVRQILKFVEGRFDAPGEPDQVMRP